MAQGGRERDRDERQPMSTTLPYLASLPYLDHLASQPGLDGFSSTPASGAFVYLLFFGNAAGGARPPTAFAALHGPVDPHIGFCWGARHHLPRLDRTRTHETAHSQAVPTRADGLGTLCTFCDELLSLIAWLGSKIVVPLICHIRGQSVPAPPPTPSLGLPDPVLLLTPPPWHTPGTKYTLYMQFPVGRRRIWRRPRVPPWPLLAGMTGPVPT